MADAAATTSSFTREDANELHNGLVANFTEQLQQQHQALMAFVQGPLLAMFAAQQANATTPASDPINGFTPPSPPTPAPLMAPLPKGLSAKKPDLLDGQKPETILPWFEGVRSYIALHGLDPATITAVTYVSTFFAPPLSQWWQNTVRSAGGCMWAGLVSVDALYDAVILAHHARDPADEARQSIRNIRQATTVALYTNEFNHLLNYLPSRHDADNVFEYRAGLRPEILKLLLMSPIISGAGNTLVNNVSVARESEFAISEARRSAAQSRQPTTARRTPAHTILPRPSAANQFEALRRGSAASPSSYAAAASSDAMDLSNVQAFAAVDWDAVEYEDDSVPGNYVAEYDDDSAAVIAVTAAVNALSSRPRPSATAAGKQVNDFPEVKCFNCNKMGHFSAQCIQPRKPRPPRALTAPGN